MIKLKLTKRQQSVYDMIREAVVKHGFSPTVREIGEHFGIKSPNGVMCHLRALERKGLIRRSPNRSRAIELVRTADRRAHSMPLAGSVAASPTELEFTKTNRVDFSEMFFENDRFILKVSGNSMIEAHIQDGDYVIIQRQKTASDGQMVVAKTDSGETLKYWYPEGNRIRLQPANRRMSPIYVEHAEVIGVAVGVVRPGL